MDNTLFIEYLVNKSKIKALSEVNNTSVETIHPQKIQHIYQFFVDSISSHPDIQKDPDMFLHFMKDNLQEFIKKFQKYSYGKNE